MEFQYNINELNTSAYARESCFLLTNGLGGYSSMSAVFSAPRCDQGVLVAAVKAPNVRINLVHRLQEKLTCADETVFLSSQDFAGQETPEEGFRYLQDYTCGHIPTWTYEASGVRVQRSCAMEHGSNTAAVVYEIENPTAEACTLTVTPFCKFAPKEEALQAPGALTWEEGRICTDRYQMYLHASETPETIPASWQLLAYPEDTKDGRPDSGYAGACCQVSKTVQPGESARLELVFSLEEETPEAEEILSAAKARLEEMEAGCEYRDPVARQLVLSADAYIARRDSTGGKTILAGYPLFSDWGRDTMIALPGCCLATGRLEDAKSILRTFLAYEKDGLVPNLFPEGENAPMYNTVDAALLLIDCVWQYVQRTNDWAFAWEAWDTMDRIITHYRKGTHHGIGMDTDGLIYAGQGLDQVTWMDVCVQGILPTPRHGKPVEINAYWYNALMIMGTMAEVLGCDQKDYLELAEQVKESFLEAFYLPEAGYLKDVISGTEADKQIRCNQIWALSMSFTMLKPHQEESVLKTVQKHLYTPYGLRTLSPEDGQYHPHYGGEQLKRDMAYHQGTTWVFPMGAYYRAWLKAYGSEGLAQVKQGLENIAVMLRQGCAGQLPEIYDGENPQEGKGCFAQAWSVGEILRVYDTIEKMENQK